MGAITINGGSISEWTKETEEKFLRGLHEGLEDACILVQGQAAQKAPIDMGELRRSITYEIEDEVGYVGTNLFYAPYVEFGTGKFAENHNGRNTPWNWKGQPGSRWEGWHIGWEGSQPHPFLRPALHDNEDKIIEKFQKHIIEGLNK